LFSCVFSHVFAACCLPRFTLFASPLRFQLTTLSAV
jgi:hypothetical protein